MNWKCRCILTLVVCVLHSHFAVAVQIETVRVGHPGNAGTNHAGGTGREQGDVDYVYHIGALEVTNQQYVEFLNQVDPAATNRFGLFNPSMQANSRGGILHINRGPVGTKFAVRAGRENHPVNYVGWYDAVRFANWMHNGQADGNTEDGAYTLNGGIPIPAEGDIPRNEGARWFLPTFDEWFKAAYHGNTPDEFYWDYPTQSEAFPPVASLPSSDPNHANWNSIVGMPVPVGSYPGSSSAYGTFDQAGNVSEWTDGLVDFLGGLQGGNWFTDRAETMSQFSSSGHTFGSNEFSDRGFRLATFVPEPSSMLLLVISVIVGNHPRRRGS